MKGCHLTCGRRGNTSPTSSNPGKTNTDLTEAKNKNKAKPKMAVGQAGSFASGCWRVGHCHGLTFNSRQKPRLQITLGVTGSRSQGRRAVLTAPQLARAHLPGPAATPLAAGSRKPQKTFQMKPACRFSTRPKCRRPSQATCSSLSFKHCATKINSMGTSLKPDHAAKK